MRVMFCASGGFGELTQGLAVARYLRKKGDVASFISRDDSLLELIKSEGFSSHKVNSPDESIKLINGFDADFVFMCNSKTAYIGKSATLTKKPAKAKVCCLDSNWLFLNDKRTCRKNCNFTSPDFLDRIYIVFPDNIYKANLHENGGHYKIIPFFKEKIIAPGFIPGGIRISKKERDKFRKKYGIAKEDKMVFLYFGQRYKKIKPYFEKVVNDIFCKLNKKEKVWLMTTHKFNITAPWYMHLKKLFKDERAFETAIDAANLVIQHHGMGTLPKCIRQQTPVLCYVPTLKKELPYYVHLETYEVKPFVKMGVCSMVAYDNYLLAKESIKELLYNKELIENMKCNQKLHFSNGEKGCYDDLKGLLRKKNTKSKAK
tara:strand:+ start:12888 stop:14006 length:1119 start_codon:yes stop_codon:yes gene_type:complete